eukprot:358162-Chlamydomonas_euryale.AAC.9
MAPAPILHICRSSHLERIPDLLATSVVWLCEPKLVAHLLHARRVAGVGVKLHTTMCGVGTVQRGRLPASHVMRSDTANGVDALGSHNNYRNTRSLCGQPVWNAFDTAEFAGRACQTHGRKCVVLVTIWACQACTDNENYAQL